MNSLDTEFHRRLSKQLTEEISRQMAALASGTLEDHAEYKRICGYIKALQDIGDWGDELERTMNQGH